MREVPLYQVFPASMQTLNAVQSAVRPSTKPFFFNTVLLFILDYCITIHYCITLYCCITLRNSLLQPEDAQRRAERGAPLRQTLLPSHSALRLQL